MSASISEQFDLSSPVVKADLHVEHGTVHCEDGTTRQVSLRGDGVWREQDRSRVDRLCGNPLTSAAMPSPTSRAALHAARLLDMPKPRLEEVGVWHVSGEDRESLGFFKGRYVDIVGKAVRTPGFDIYGRGGHVEPVPVTEVPCGCQGCASARSNRTSG